MSELYNLTLEGTSDPHSTGWNEFADHVVYRDPSTRTMRQHDFENFLLDDMDQYIDDFHSRLTVAWDIASDLCFFDTKPRATDNVDEDLPDCEAWPVTTNWKSSCQIKINDPDMLPMIREMISYIGKYNGNQKGTRFTLVSLEPTTPAVSTVADAVNITNIRGKQAASCASVGESATFEGASAPPMDEFVSSADDILYGSIRR